jgi:ribulose-5-phosphate 4-epimerase/fuculose-1-phosphate aldolase
MDSFIGWLRAGALAAALLPALAAGAGAQGQNLNALIDQLVAANRVLYKQGIVDGFGHVSVRHPEHKDRYLMSQSVAPGLVTKDDIMEFDLDSKPLDQRGRTIYTERFIHSEIYKLRPDVNAIMHSHSPTVIPFAASTVPLKPIFNSAGFLYPEVPVFEMRKQFGSGNLLVPNAKVAKALAESLGDRPVVLMRGHGNVVVGPSIPRVVSRAIYTEVNARLQLQAISLGGPLVYIDEAEARAGEAFRDKGEKGQATDRTWLMWVEDAMGPQK